MEYGWCVLDPATMMVDLEDFGTNLRTGVEYVGHKMGWDMDVEIQGWKCKKSGIGRLRYGHWETRPLLWEVLAYAILHLLTEMEACNWNSRLYLKSHNIY